MKKYIQISVLISFLLIPLVAPAGSMYLKDETEEGALVYLGSSELPSTMILENTTIIRKTVRIDGHIFGTVNIICNDVVSSNGTAYIKVVADYTPLDKSDYGLIIQTPLIPCEYLGRSNAIAHTAETITQKSKERILIIENPVRYAWDENITFISVQSQPLHVNYDHPDNGPYSNPSYDIPPNENNPTILTGHSTHIFHLPKYILDDAKTKNTLITGIADILAPIIWALIGAPEALGTKMAAALLAVVEGIITGLGLVINLFIDNVCRTELDDGWMYMGGCGSWWVFHWCWISFGSLRDLHWPVIWIDPGWDDPYDGTKDPWTWYNPFYTKPITCWYRFSENKGVYIEWKCAPTGAYLREDNSYP